MDYYWDLTLLPDPDFSPALLMSALYNKLHRALVEHAQLNIGISFPEHSLSPRSLGNCLRLHGTKADLESLQHSQWLSGMRDHLQLKEILAIPDQVQNIQVRRVQAKSSPERLAKRYAKRHNIAESEALTIYQQLQPKKLRQPFVTLNSQSTKQRFSLFIQQEKPQLTAVNGDFNRYGLSTTATVPWF